MSLVSAEVIENPSKGAPYVAIYRHGKNVIFQHDAQTVEEGEAWILALLGRLKAIADQN